MKSPVDFARRDSISGRDYTPSRVSGILSVIQSVEYVQRIHRLRLSRVGLKL